MAKFECNIQGDFATILATIDQGILQGSSSASLEDWSEFGWGDVRCGVRVYERYSMAGGNRVSLTVTLFGAGMQYSLSGITAGGSQAMFWKVNTLGEETFLDELVRVVNAMVPDMR